MSGCFWRGSPGHVWRALLTQSALSIGVTWQSRWPLTICTDGLERQQWVTVIREPDLLLETAMLALHGVDDAIRFHTPSFSLGGEKCRSYQRDLFMCWRCGWEHSHLCCHGRTHLRLPSLTLPVSKQWLSGMDEAMESREKCRKRGW